VIPAPAERVWDLLADVEHWPSWYRACRWVRLEQGRGTTPPVAARAVSFRWKAHPLVVHSTVVAADRPRRFAMIADARGLHAERTFSMSPSPDGLGTTIIDHEVQFGPLPRLGRAFLARRLSAANRAMLDDLARAVGPDALP
jgi:uncharacterized protein YndB with AHSA1/START domain